MDSIIIYVGIGLALLIVLGVGTALVLSRRGEPRAVKPRPGIDYAPGVGDDDTTPRDTPRRTIEQAEGGIDTLALPDDSTDTVDDLAVWEVEVPAPAEGRLARLRNRLARSQNSLGRGLLVLLSRDDVDEATWDEVEEILLTADLGVSATTELVDRLRLRVRAEATASPEALSTMVREELLALVDPSMDRSVVTERADHAGPAVILVVGVNGTGKTTTTGKLARLLIAQDRTVLLGAADTFRAAAAEQLQTWGDRVGAAVVRGPEGGDPAAVAFDAVKIGTEADVDTVVIDTAGRLHTKVGLMDELGKVKRVVEKHGPVDEVLLVLDATTGQNGMNQARVFAEVVDISGIVLTKLDGTAKGGIVVAVQRELGVPVKLVGLGEGPDDLAPFDPVAFVDAIVQG
ncbi:MAG: signal recognition particle-docking protein FtsY [Candidatus Nanopelagicales bacterium]